MLIVSNTSPILNLAIIHRLDFLRDQFKQVLIPSAVRADLKLDADYPGAAIIRAAMDAGWLREENAKDVNLERALALELDKGEVT